MESISYAQNGEDVRLSRAFPSRSGFYIDVGACDPVLHSVTKLFYERGWSGINIEPTASVFEILRADRSRDINLNLGLSNCEGTLTFYEAVTSKGWSTFSPELVAGVKKDLGIDFIERAVPVTTLAAVCARYVDRPIDFLKIDVENHERQVLEGADWSRWRPRALVIEGQDRTLWEDLVLGANYVFATFDGLNQYYVRAEDQGLARLLADPEDVREQALIHCWAARADMRQRLVKAHAALRELQAHCRPATAPPCVEQTLRIAADPELRQAVTEAQIALADIQTLYEIWAAEFEDVGPNALAWARRLHRWAFRFPRLAATARRWLPVRQAG
jgi:FkbM family methyltransferase